MKALLVSPGPQFSVADVHNGLLAGLRANGVDAQEFNLHDRLNFYSEAHMQSDGDWVRAFSPETAIAMAVKGLENVLYEWWPDLVVIMSGFFISPAMWAVLARRPHHVVLYCTESPYEDDRQAQAARYADTVILNDPSNLEAMRADNTRTFYLPHSYNPDLHKPGPSIAGLESPFTFVGTGFPSRIEFFNKVDWRGMRPKFAGNWQAIEPSDPIAEFVINAKDQCVDNVDTVRLYQSCGLSANMYRREHSDASHAEGWACGPREIELAATGTFFLRESRGESDALFPMLPTYDSPESFTDLLHWWHSHPVEKQDAANAAREAVTDMTFNNTAANLLRLVDGHVKRIR